MKLADRLNMLAQLNVYTHVTTIGSTQHLTVGDAVTWVYDEQGYFLSGYVQESDYSV